MMANVSISLAEASGNGFTVPSSLTLNEEKMDDSSWGMKSGSAGFSLTNLRGILTRGEGRGAMLQGRDTHVRSVERAADSEMTE